MWNYYVNSGGCVVSDFKELNEPQLECVLSRRPERWFVTATDHKFLVNDGKTLACAGATFGENDKLYFNSKTEAFTYSAKYYWIHRKNYPYHTEWQIAVDLSKSAAIPTELKSEVMKFK